MKKEEYLRNLKFQLIDFPGEDLSQIEDFYEELILDGIEQGYTEEEIISKMEAPEEVASKIRAEYGGIVVYTCLLYTSHISVSAPHYRFHRF